MLNNSVHKLAIISGFSLTIQQISALIVNRSELLSISNNALGITDNFNNIHSIALRLLDFIIESTKCGEHGERPKEVLSSNFTVSQLANRFISYAIEHSSECSPCYEYYLRLIVTLRNSKIFRIADTDTGVVYSLSDDELPICPKDMSMSDDYINWPSPQLFSDNLNDMNNQIEIAKFFWNEAVNRYRKEIPLTIYDLTYYTFAKFGIPSTDSMLSYKEQLMAMVHTPQAHKIINEFSDDSLSRFMLYAKRVYTSWDNDTKDVFKLRHLEEKSVEEIAYIKGYSSSQSTDYYLEKAYNSIREFWLQWETFSKYSEEEQACFGQALVNICEH